MTELITSDYADISKTNTTKCKHCYKIIKRGLPRIRRSFMSQRYGIQNGFVCLKCYKKVISQEIIDLTGAINRTKNIKKDMAKLVKKNQKLILACEIEDATKNLEGENR